MSMRDTVTIDVSKLIGDAGPAKVALLPRYEEFAVQAAGSGRHVVLTGAGPIWLYLRVAHALHGRAASLDYESPVTGRIRIFDHTPT